MPSAGKWELPQSSISKLCHDRARDPDSQMLMRRHALFIGVLIIIAAARSTILLASQTLVHSDEAIIGLMGKHILERRYFPFYHVWSDL